MGKFQSYADNKNNNGWLFLLQQQSLVGEGHSASQRSRRYDNQSNRVRH